MTDLVEVVASVAGDHYFSLPLSTSSRREGDLFVGEMVGVLHKPGLLARVREAARDCEADPVLDPSTLQQNLRAALIDRFMAISRPHPRLADQAAAFADTIIAEYGLAVETAALKRARQLATAPSLEIERAREREAEIARNRPRPARRPLYPV
jgi:hypothetical protein